MIPSGMQLNPPQLRFLPRQNNIEALVEVRLNIS
jgi:hypothetical protein